MSRRSGRKKRHSRGHNTAAGNKKRHSSKSARDHHEHPEQRTVLQNTDHRQEEEGRATTSSSSLELDAGTINHVVSLLHSAGMRPVGSLGRRCGHWVTDVSILQLLAFLDTEESKEVTWQGEAYDVRMCHLDDSIHVCDPDVFSEGPLEKNLIVLFIHIAGETQGLHFSAVVISAARKLVHVFDTLSTWSIPKIKYTLHQQFPLLGLFSLRKEYCIRNHTGKVLQSGGTCGPWSLWICFAYAMNFRGCRDPDDDSINYTCLEQSDALRFWMAFTR